MAEKTTRPLTSRQLEEIAEATVTALESGETAFFDAVSCRERRPSATCTLVSSTCAAFVATQPPLVQGAAITAIAALTEPDVEGAYTLIAKWLQRLCGKDDLCRALVKEGIEDTGLAKEISIETAYNAAYFSAVAQGGPVVYRGLALDEDHPLVKRSRACKSRRSRYCFASIGEHYQPKPLESWTGDKAIAETFARNKASEDKVPVILAKRLNIWGGRPLTAEARRAVALPAISSFTNRGCLFSEKEIALLWTNPGINYQRDIGSGDVELELSVLEEK